MILTPNIQWGSGGYTDSKPRDRCCGLASYSWLYAADSLALALTILGICSRRRGAYSNCKDTFFLPSSLFLFIFWPNTVTHFCKNSRFTYIWPSSWAIVKAALSPLSCTMAQDDFILHIVPNSARPSVSHFCRDGFLQMSDLKGIMGENPEKATKRGLTSSRAMQSHGVEGRCRPLYSGGSASSKNCVAYPKQIEP